MAERGGWTWPTVLAAALVLSPMVVAADDEARGSGEEKTAGAAGERGDEEAKPASGDGEEAGGDADAGFGSSLDELLGLEDDERDVEAAGGNVADSAREELERSLTGREIGDRFIEALQQMDESADRLDELSDAGVVTQRLQEEVLRKLDVLIEQSEQQEQQQRSRSSSSSSQQEQQARAEQQRRAQQRSEAEAEERGSQNTGSEAPPPGRQDEELNPMVDAAAAAWGSLPERVREALVQGLNDRFSSRYERETERYYRRLAEQGDGGESGGGDE